jgi:cysteine desulfurase / selenocysteine lyase
MTQSDGPKDGPQVNKDRSAHPGRERWIAERVLDPAVLAKMANEFFTALPEFAQPADWGAGVNVPSDTPQPPKVAGVTQPAESPVGPNDFVFPGLEQLRELPSAVKNLAGSEIAFDAITNPTPWIPAIPGRIADAGAQQVPSFSFLTETRPLFGDVVPLFTADSNAPHLLKSREKSAAQETTKATATPPSGGFFGAPRSFGAPVRAETPKRPAGFAFLNEAQELLPSEGAQTPDVADIQPAAVPEENISSRSFEVGQIRRDFPILQERVNGRPLIWFDNAATTQKPQAVVDRLDHFYSHENSNIHRAAHEMAARATDAYEAAREKVRRFLNASSSREIVFVRGATEGINLVAQSWGRQNVGKDDEIVITWLEHHANIVPWQMLCAEKGARLRVAPVDDTGQVLLDEYTKLVGPKTRLVSFAHVSNALGTVTPAQEMIEIAHRHGATVLLDGAQAVSHMPVDVQWLDCDFYVFSGHKLFAPTGIGVVYGKADILERTQPWQGGGSMIVDVTFDKTVYNVPPARFEAGTGSIADAVGLGAAIDYVQRIGMASITGYEQDLLAYATAALLKVPGLRLIGTAKDKASVLSFVLDGFRTEDVGTALNREGIAVRAGHHCAQPIHRRFGLESSVRASLALYNTCEEVDALVAALWNLKQGHRSGI